MVTSVSTTVHLSETAIIKCEAHGWFDSIRLADHPTTVDLFMGDSDEVAVTVCDRLIEALHEARSAALARIVKSAA